MASGLLSAFRSPLPLSGCASGRHPAVLEHAWHPRRRWPDGVITLLVVASPVPGHLRRVHHMVDYPDTAVLSLAVTALILLTSLDGTTYPLRQRPSTSWAWPARF